jgi:hypothetical protein
MTFENLDYSDLPDTILPSYDDSNIDQEYDEYIYQQNMINSELPDYI